MDGGESIEGLSYEEKSAVWEGIDGSAPVNGDGGIVGSGGTGFVGIGLGGYGQAELSVGGGFEGGSGG